MTNNRNGSKDIIIQKEEIAFKLRAKGWSQQKIAKKLKMTQQGVSSALKRITKRFSQRFFENVKETKYEQVARLEYVIQEAMDSWYASKKVYRNKRTIKVNQFGNPRFLLVTLKALSDIRKLIGVDELNEAEDQLFGKIQLEIIDKTTPTE